MDLFTLSSALQKTPELYSTFNLKGLQTYSELINLLRPKLSCLQASYQRGPPPQLPVKIHQFLKLCFAMSDYMGKLAWESFRTFVWAQPFADIGEEHAAIVKHRALFLEHGIPLQLAIYNLEPPTRVCLDTRCSRPLHSDKTILRANELVEAVSHPITVFTKDLGPVPGYATSRYCRKCNARYYHNYYVENASRLDSMRVYYTSTPTFIQSSQHLFISPEVCELFAAMMVTSCTSATNCAHIYNQGINTEDLAMALPPDWPTTLELGVGDVWNSFFMHALMLDHNETGTILKLPHIADSQAKRLQHALQARNAKTAGTGQEAWNHACDRCLHRTPGANPDEFYPIRSTVTDGITIGRPTCSVADCKIPLRSVKDHFCPQHAARAKLCVVTACDQVAEAGFQTCRDAGHRKLEMYRREQGKAMFMLKKRFERLNITQVSFSPGTELSADMPGAGDDISEAVEGPGVGEDEDVEVAQSEVVNFVVGDVDIDEREQVDFGIGATADRVDGTTLLDQTTLPEVSTSNAQDEGDVCDGKPDTGNRNTKARFGRRWTHNEELCVASCGVILGRATFYGSEAPNGVRTFWMKLFPTRASLPHVLWHDNNCRILAMLNNDGEDNPQKYYFEGCALPVDVFHFKSKHKESDVDCGRQCNPFKFTILRNEKGEWRFNSSAAEQTNAWFGGFQSMVREMQVDRYEFFLDEMIKRRNRLIIKQLKRRGEKPYSIPRKELLRPDED